MKKITIILIMFLVGYSASYAQQRVPAIPTPVKFTQPDGTEIQFRVKGDERVHYRTTLDKYLIKMDDEGYYCYVKMGCRYRIKITDSRVGIDEVPKRAYKMESKYLNYLHERSKHSPNNNKA